MCMNVSSTGLFHHIKKCRILKIILSLPLFYCKINYCDDLFSSHGKTKLQYFCFQSESRQTSSSVIRGALLTAEPRVCVCVCASVRFCGVLVWVMLLVTSESEVPICVWVKELEKSCCAERSCS